MDGHQKQREQSAIMMENALFTLLEEKEFAAISVSEIASRADLARRTFYRLYQKKEDILHQYFVRLCWEYREACPVLENYDFSAIAGEYFGFWYRHRKRLLLLYKRGLANILFREISGASREVIQGRMGERAANGMELFADYSAGGFLMLLHRWLENGMSGTPQAYAQKVCASLRICIRPVAAEKNKM